MQHQARYALAAISNPAIFAREYPEIASAGREFLRGRPGIGEFRLICAHISVDATIKTNKPIEARIWLESATRSLAISLEPNERGDWIARVETDRELRPWERTR